MTGFLNNSFRTDEALLMMSSSNQLFENLPDLIKPQLAADTLGISIKTIYDWRYRGKTRNIPSNLFVKLGRLLYVRKEALKHWINSQNNTLF